MHSVVDVLVSNVGGVVAGLVCDAVQEEDHVRPGDHMVQLFTHLMNILNHINEDNRYICVMKPAFEKYSFSIENAFCCFDSI